MTSGSVRSVGAWYKPMRTDRRVGVRDVSLLSTSEPRVIGFRRIGNQKLRRRTPTQGTVPVIRGLWLRPRRLSGERRRLAKAVLTDPARCLPVEGGATFTVTELAYVPTARAVERICAWSRRSLAARADDGAKKIRRPSCRLAKRTCSRSGDGNVWRSARSNASSFRALRASEAMGPYSVMAFSPEPVRREGFGASRCMDADIF
ncbi:hypothetical protein DYST_03902 [Dyella terrae]|nr:hypothetical protein DYST_03902 [Dyella terrae]